MQLMIDILQETPERLRLASKFLEDHAALIEKSEAGRADESLGLNVPAVPAGTSTAPVVPPAPPAPPPPPSNVLPFVPPVPPSVAIPTAPAAPPAPSVPPVASTLSVPVSPVTTTTGALPTTDEYDSAGMPWDVRIHQKTKNKKKDGTYKLLKGVDPGLVSSVVVELQAQGRIRQDMAGKSTAPSVDPLTLFGKTALPPGASAPVSLPPQAYQAGQLPPPPPAPGAYPQSQESTQTQNAQVPAPPAPPQAPVNLPPAPPVPMPPSASMGMPNAGQPPVLPAVSEFRALVDKITKLRTAGKLTSDQVNAAIQQAGAPSLQMLGSLSHLVPTVDALIDATLAMG